ncbi:MAG: DMT family transporter [Rhodobacteraceae bacterium]|nr:DMT family transporter [Paracoccaceae bacterium]
MLATGILFVGVNAIVKHVGSELPATQSAFLRFVFGLVFLLPTIGVLFRTRIDRGSLRLFGIRGAVHTVAVILWFFSMARIPMAEVTAMNYLAPVYVTVGAALFLGERLAMRRILAVGVAILGVLIILRPGFREIEAGHIAMLGTAFFMGCSYLIGKRVSGAFDPAIIVWMLSITVTLGLLPFAIAVWVPPTWEQVGWMFLVAGFATAAHYTMTLAFQAAPVNVTQPVTFLQLVWASLVGWLLFNELPDIWVFVGGALIIAAISYIAIREAQLRRSVTPQPEATKAGH